MYYIYVYIYIYIFVCSFAVPLTIFGAWFASEFTMAVSPSTTSVIARTYLSPKFAMYLCVSCQVHTHTHTPCCCFFRMQLFINNCITIGMFMSAGKYRNILQYIILCIPRYCLKNIWLVESPCLILRCLCGLFGYVYPIQNQFILVESLDFCPTFASLPFFDNKFCWSDGSKTSLVKLFICYSWKAKNVFIILLMMSSATNVLPEPFDAENASFVCLVKTGWGHQVFTRLLAFTKFSPGFAHSPNCHQVLEITKCSQFLWKSHHFFYRVLEIY